MSKKDTRIDVLSGREVLWITSNIARMRRLVHSYVVNSHMSWEREMIKIHHPEVGRHAQVNYDILVR